MRAMIEDGQFLSPVSSVPIYRVFCRVKKGYGHYGHFLSSVAPSNLSRVLQC